MRKDTYGSVENEPAFRSGPFLPDPSEQGAARPSGSRSEIEVLRDSVRSEPHLAERADLPLPSFGTWLETKRRRCTLAGNLGATLLAALAGGPFAILGAFMVGQEGLLAGLYIVLFGPVIEELLKQSGMVYLLEHKPYRIFAGWQFVAAAVLSAAVFATVENLLYIHVYVSGAEGVDLVSFARFRWVVCTALHVCCSAIASLGLIRVWTHQTRTGQPAELGHAFPLFVVAIGVHGCYNLFVIFIGDLFTTTP